MDDHRLSAVVRERLKEAGVDFSNPFALITIAEQINREGDLEAALHIVNFAVMLAPDDTLVLRGASGVIAESRNYQRCDTLMRRAVALAPDNAECRLHYAVILIELRDFTSARQEIDAHLQLAPESDLGWRNLSTVLACQGDYAGACTACERALLINPANREYAIHLVGLLIVLERVPDALIELQRLNDEKLDDAVVMRLFSAAAEAAGDSDAALMYAKRAYALAPHQLEYEQHLEHLEQVRGTIQAIGAKRVLDPCFPPTMQVKASRWLQFYNAAAANRRVISSLLIREARTRFGGTQLGYVWAIFEPVTHLTLLAVVFSFMHTSGGAPIGESLLIYYFTGVLPYILFTNTIMHVQVALEANRSLLQIPVIKPLDTLLARALLELLTQISVAVIMFTVFTLCGLDGIPQNIVRCVQAILAVWLLGMGFGVINSVVMHFIKSWDHIFANFTRALYFISGIFFSPLAMPPAVLEYLAWNPLLQGIDLFRAGFYGFYQPYWLNTTYLFACSIFVATIGFGMERALRRQVSSP